MKKILLASLIAGASLSSTAFAYDGQVTFTGEIVNSTCVVETDDNSGNQTVALPKIAASALSEAGRVAGTTPFDIKIKDCGTTSKTVKALFENDTAVDAATGVLNVTATVTDGLNSPEQVGVQLLNANLEPINIAESKVKASTNNLAADGKTFAIGTDGENSGKATLRYYARYYAKAKVTGFGKFTTVANYSIQYE